MKFIDKYNCIIIGAGAAGLISGGVSAQRGRKTLVIDKNDKPARKVRITGKGRCNVTNDCEVREVIEAVPNGGKFLYSALNSFTPEDTKTFFENLGVPLKTERGKRVFPISDSAHDIANALVKFAEQNGAKIIKDTAVLLIIENEKIVGVKTKRGNFAAESVLIATGGLSYPGTGSTGDGYRMARAVGHTITKTAPSLIPLVEDGNICEKLMGLSLKNCEVKIISADKSKPVYKDFGELLFTHFGLSGPTILSASAHMRPMESGKFKAVIDLKPALSEQQLDLRILRDFDKNKNKIFENSLNELLPQKLIPIMVELSEIDGQKRCNEITQTERRKFRDLLKAFEIKIAGFRPIAEAIITSGGVSIKEIEPKTMKSKLIDGLYFAGEVIDVDAYTGGFNLQIAFSTGFAAGQAM